ncbi:integral membrane protein DUF106-domain-containing protein [Protomyces lactucae-debilis]|uniref:ER membrane protein complex subunit 3 n=1 Tax=Protomyces lactucae-debilis TaxID=2754530 RepID=A0A1Y2FGD3_PROLT|nr:integral membrane protein DUF106-domain-containing protein [Protomyces lactucae-debilis]ORY81885.1 integral membrane protein DUF106-domain-containing protein [Protomyces lactucae-debilis]
MSEQVLLLDSSLRNWALLPILLVMILVGLLRHNVTILLQSTPKPLDTKAVREQRALSRAALLRANGHHLPSDAFAARRSFLIDAFTKDAYLKDPSAKGRPAANPMTDPSAMDGMMNMMKGNMANMVPQMGLMAWINFFFSGFVLLKLPFPLTLRFKQMLQSGVMTQDLDVTWVSSLSWYFLNLFGLQSIYALLLGDDNAAGSVNDMNQMGGAGAMQAFGPGQDPSKMFGAEIENLEVASHVWINHNVAERVLARYSDEL